jgi:hypothetical protein
MNTSIIGNNGSGKTFLLTYFGSKFKRNIYSNYKLNMDNYIPLTINDLLEMNNFNEGNVFIDEAYTWIESRRSGSALNLITTYLVFQKRKRFLDVYLTEQLFSSIDKRVRELSNIIIECKPRINDKIDDFEFLYIDRDSNIQFEFIIPYEVAENYFPYYNTYEIIDIPNKSKYEYDILCNDNKRFNERFKEIAYFINPSLEKLTHDRIFYLLQENGFDKRFEKSIYIYLKEGGIS